jgi:hypothetical protein
VTFYLDGVQAYSLAVQDRLPFRLPSSFDNGGTKTAFVARDWEVKIEGNTEIFGLVLGQSRTEVDSA